MGHTISDNAFNFVSRAKSTPVQIIDGLLDSPVPKTSLELAIELGLDRKTTARRLPELHRRKLCDKGDPRECTVSGRLAQTWFV